MKTLVIIHPFGGYARGDVITDTATQEDVLKGENKHHVVSANHQLPATTPATPAA